MNYRKSRSKKEKEGKGGKDNATAASITQKPTKRRANQKLSLCVSQNTHGLWKRKDNASKPAPEVRIEP